MRNFKIFFIAIIFAVSSFVFFGCNNTESPIVTPTVTAADVINDVRSGVVEVSCWGRIGSGFVANVSNDGCIIITNYHVIVSAVDTTSDVLRVRFDGFDEDELASAVIIGYNRLYDIAIIKTEWVPQNIKALSFANQSALGTDTLSLGYHSDTLCAYDGMVSGTEKLVRVDSEYGEYLYLTEVTAPAPSGTSGGPCVNYKGEVVGLNAFSTQISGAIAAISYKVPSNIVKAVYQNIIRRGTTGIALSAGFNVTDNGFIEVTCFEQIFYVSVTPKGLKIAENIQQIMPVGKIIDFVNGKKATLTEFLAEIILTKEQTSITFKN